MSETVQPLVDVLFPYIGYLIPLPIIIPAVAAALALIFCRIPNAQRQIVFFSLLITAVVNATLILIADF